MKNDDLKARPREAKADEEHQVYVTLESARKAASYLAQVAIHKWSIQLRKTREQLQNEVINQYLSFAIPTEKDEPKRLQLTYDVALCHGEGETARYYHLSLYDTPIKPVREPVQISLVHMMALCELESEIAELKKRQEDMEQRLLAEIMYMREKECIEACLPQAMPYLQFQKFLYDTAYWNDVCSQERIDDHKAYWEENANKNIHF